MKNKKTKIKIKSKYLILIFIATLFMGIGYASISGQILTIIGDVEAKAQHGVIITRIEQSSNNGAITSEVSYYNKTVMKNKIVLENSGSSVTYKVTLYNNSEVDYVFIEPITDKQDTSIYSNSNIGFSLTGLTNYQTTIAPHEYKEFNITFAYAGNTSNKLLNSIINFRFKEKPSLALEHEGETVTSDAIDPENPVYIPFTVTYNSLIEKGESYYEEINGMKCTLSTTGDNTLNYTILKEDGTEYSSGEEITIDANGATKVIHNYRLKISWNENYNSIDYLKDIYNAQLKLIGKPKDEKYLDYKIEKSFSINVTPDSSYFENAVGSSVDYSAGGVTNWRILSKNESQITIVGLADIDYSSIHSENDLKQYIASTYVTSQENYPITGSGFTTLSSLTSYSDGSVSYMNSEMEKILKDIGLEYMVPTLNSIGDNYVSSLVYSDGTEGTYYAIPNGYSACTYGYWDLPPEYPIIPTLVTITLNTSATVESTTIPVDENTTEEVNYYE